MIFLALPSQYLVDTHVFIREELIGSLFLTKSNLRIWIELPWMLVARFSGECTTRVEYSPILSLVLAWLVQYFVLQIPSGSSSSEALNK